LEAIHETGSKIAGKKTHSNKMSDRTRNIMEKRRQVKMDSRGFKNVAYTETRNLK
jgi:hypothetical protein